MMTLENFSQIWIANNAILLFGPDFYKEIAVLLKIDGLLGTIIGDTAGQDAHALQISYLI